MKGKASIFLSIAAAFAFLVFGSGGASASVAVRVVDDDGQQCPTATDTTIQGALSSLPPGGRVEVCPGLYSGPVYVSQPVEIQAVEQPGVPHTPAAVADRASCLSAAADDPTTESIVENTEPYGDGFELYSGDVGIDGMVTRGSQRAGVEVRQAGSGYVFNHDVVQGNGSGLEIGSDGASPSTIANNCIRRNSNGVDAAGFQPLRNVSINGNHFNAQQNGAIVLQAQQGADSLSDLAITGNDSTGDAPVPWGFVGFLALIDSERVTVIGNTATTSAADAIWLLGNHDLQIKGNTLRSARDGILFLHGNTGDPAQSAINVTSNDIEGMQWDGIRADSASADDSPSLLDSYIAQNTVVSNGRDGVHLGLGTSRNVIENNALRSNVAYDCYDESNGTGTAGTANTWQGNDAQTENVPGLCVTDNDLALAHVPGNISVNATSPSGAVVTYTTPTAIDEDTPLPTVTCDHASGSTFAIGTTTVTCTVGDSDDLNSPISASFAVTVKGAMAQLQDLLAYVANLPPGTSLSDKGQTAISYLQAGDIADACSTLTSIITEATSQSGKHLTPVQANYIIATARRIQAVLAC
jgi:Right handed beta helix region/HYR domain